MQRHQTCRSEIKWKSRTQKSGDSSRQVNQKECQRKSEQIIGSIAACPTVQRKGNERGRLLLFLLNSHPSPNKYTATTRRPFTRACICLETHLFHVRKKSPSASHYLVTTRKHLIITRTYVTIMRTASCYYEINTVYKNRITELVFTI